MKSSNTVHWIRQRGFSIVEVLVALVVLAVGMLGIAGLYVTTLRTGGSALYRTQAINAASDIADRIRANPTAATAYAGAGTNNNCAGTGAVSCSPANLAADDLFRWRDQVDDVLPYDAASATPQTAITVTGTARPRIYEITVRWIEAGDNSVLSYVLRMQI